MGLFDSLFGSAPSTSQTTLPNAWGNIGYAQSGQLADMMKALLGGQSSSYAQPLQNAITNPQFGPQNVNEANLLRSLADMTQGTSALRGLGPATPSALASSLAPALIGLQQQNVQNLMGGMGLDLASRGQTLGGLDQLLGFAMPQNVITQSGGQQGMLPGLLGGMGALGGNQGLMGLLGPLMAAL
ncbi:MAG: hypothetical protein KGJ89_05080 [Patescibacteria group bacterium]|nr:hypothetical protein [Patescibacteria group bacterium]MDE2227295.1 hypothetical protein [Patescibacteria group bacterium]